MPQHFKKVGQNLFCSDFALEQALSHTHQFLSHLSGAVDFEKLWQEKLLTSYKGGASLGQPPYPPAMMLKMLFLSFLFKVSEREVERLSNDSISFKHFLGLGLIDRAPDHSSLTRFKDRILQSNERKGEDLLSELFDDVILFAQEKGVKLGFIQAIDSTHTLADVNTRKEKKRTKPIREDGEGKKTRDPDARWGVKRVIPMKTITGKTVKVRKSYYGYKSHLSVNTETNLVTSFRVTPFNAYDGHLMKPLLDDDLRKGAALPRKMIYTADKAYDDGENHVWLNQARLFDAIDLKYVKDHERTAAGKPLVRWKAFTTQDVFEKGLSQRFAVERVNASLKKDLGLGRARYLGLAKMKTQTALTCLAHNLKTLVKLWTGIGLKTMSTAHVSSVA